MINLRFSSSDSFEKLGVDSVWKENQSKIVGNHVLEPKIKRDQLFCLFRRMFAVLPFFLKKVLLVSQTNKLQVCRSPSAFALHSKTELFVTMGFSLNGAELSLNSLNTWNLGNH